MRIPLSWLGEFVDLEPGTTTADVHAALVSVGLEEEDVHTFDLSGPIVVGEVLEFVEEPQSNGKTIRWCQVRVSPEGKPAADGGESVRGIVCGARNFDVGDKVVVTLPGAVLPGPFPIAARKTYGHISDGMIASARELGLGDEHDGILRLAALGIDAEAGRDAASLLGLDDAAVEVNVTPDRGYALSIRGIAREYSHATGAAFRDPAVAPGLAGSDDGNAEPSGISVAIADGAPIRGRVGSTVFVTRVVRDVDGGRPTPAWMISRLALAGIRSISLIVDITNYVMLELGQPLHGYDFAKLRGGIVVRRAASGEKLTTLDGVTRTLDPEDLLITDDSGPIGLAGVMGGESTQIDDTTTTVLIEAANFDPISVARTARRHKLPSEASRRFERGVDPAVAQAAASRAVQLLVQLADGVADDRGSKLDESVRADEIFLPDGYVSGIIGVDYTAEEIDSALAEIGGVVKRVEGGRSVQPPTWRPDIAGKADLAEEVARINGYDKIPSILPVAPPGRGLTRSQQLRRQAAQALAAFGLTEVLAYPFVSEASNNTFGSATDGEVPAVRIANALDATAPFMRTSLLPGLTDVARRNISRGLSSLAVYEIGLVFRPEAGTTYGTQLVPAGAVRPSDDVLIELDRSIPPQSRYLAALFTGNSAEKQPGAQPVHVGIADALRSAHEVANAVGARIDIRQGSHQAFHPGRTAELAVLNGSERVVVGYAGELLPSLAVQLGLPQVTAALELDLDSVIASSVDDIQVAALSGFPAATQDLSLVVSAGLPAADVLNSLTDGAGPLLESATLVDDYRGSGVAAGMKSLTFALRFRAADRTLTAAEASEAKLAGAARAEQLFGASVRD